MKMIVGTWKQTLEGRSVKNFADTIKKIQNAPNINAQEIHKINNKISEEIHTLYEYGIIKMLVNSFLVKLKPKEKLEILRVNQVSSDNRRMVQ